MKDKLNETEYSNTVKLGDELYQFVYRQDNLVFVTSKKGIILALEKKEYEFLLKEYTNGNN